MKKMIKFGLFMACIICLFALGTLLADKFALQSDIIRLHVVANSDSVADQTVKLAVRDAITEYLAQNMNDFNTASQASQFITENLCTLEQVANDALRHTGSIDTAAVSLKKEAFDKRDYDTFSLPSGIYRSLNVTIGSGAGANWWCVVFPAFCVPATTDGFQAVAVSEGFNSELVSTLTRENSYNCRFFLLDCIGKIENFFQSL